MTFHFHIECDWCDKESYVSTTAPLPEPEHCPMCGENCRPTMVGEDDVSDDIGDIIDM